MKLERYKDKKETRKRVILISLTVLTIVSITMVLYKTFANFRTSTSFQIMSGKVVYKQKGKDLTEVVETTTSGSGLYEVTHSSPNGWTQKEYRYAGSSPNNYVYFNCNDTEQSASTCEKWRIIGLVNVKTSSGSIEQRIKIIRNDSIGDYSWDYQNGTNENDWTKASLMGLLNSTYYNSLNENTYCYKASSSPTTCNFSSSGNPKGLTSKARDMIDSTVTWTLGGWSDSEVTAEAMYGYERGNKVYQGRPIEWNLNTTKDPATNQSKSDLFRGVGLMYPSDYGYAVGGGVRTACLKQTLYTYNSGNCKDNDWLYSGNYQYLLSPISSYLNMVFDMFSSGYVDYYGDVINALAVRPVVFLNSNIKIGEGKGTETEPYELTAS